MRSTNGSPMYGQWAGTDRRRRVWRRRPPSEFSTPITNPFAAMAATLDSVLQVMGDRIGVLPYGQRVCTLAGRRREIVGACKRLPLGSDKAAFDGDMDRFLRAHPEAASQCYNWVKRCAACGKICAMSMIACNGCSSSLSDVQPSKTFNVFMGFIHGVARGEFAYRISLRAETSNVIVFDDPLALTPAHVCAVPTDVYVPTALELFSRPRQGALLLRQLEAAAWTALEQHYLDDSDWQSQVYGRMLRADELRDHVIAGMNVPPSQFQLHLQFMLPPLLPKHYALFRCGLHFAPSRFLPLDYLLRALDNLSDVSLTATDVPTLAEQVQRTLGLDYSTEIANFATRVSASQRHLAHWRPVDFRHLVADNEVLADIDAAGNFVTAAHNGVDVATLLNTDTRMLQGYGKPYDAEGKPTGRFLSKASFL